MTFPEMKVYCPPQPARPINNGTFTKKPEPTTPTFLPLPVPLHAQTAAKVHRKQSPLLLIEAFQLSANSVYPSEALQLHTNGPNAGGNRVRTPLNASLHFELSLSQ